MVTDTLNEKQVKLWWNDILQDWLLQCQTRVHLIIIKSHTHSLSINHINVFVTKINKIQTVYLK